ncbi:MAG TPA: DUF1559 domain-containing protein [Abditibacteriaceae bacterium]
MKRGFTFLQLLGLLAVVGIAAAILFPKFMPARECCDNRPSCQSNLKQIALGVKQYVQDYDAKFPSNTSGASAYGWADAIQPYVKNTQIYQCPAETNSIQQTPNPRAAQYTDYWFNTRMEKLSEAKLSYISNTIMLGDGNTGTDLTNARYSISSLPVSWIENQSSPAYRHVMGANYAYADGHVKWLKTNQVSNRLSSGTDTSSFAIR